MADQTTPRPWRAFGTKVEAFNDTVIPAGIVSPEDATLIVRAVNAHEALVEACQTCATLLDIDNDPGRIWGQSAKETMLKALYHALALARGDKEGE